MSKGAHGGIYIAHFTWFKLLDLSCIHFENYLTFKNMSTTYISCACNRVPHSADWGNNGLICYGACNRIAIYDPCEGEIGKVLETLHRHKDKVRTVRWIRSRNLKPETELLSGSADGTAVVWSKLNNQYEPTSTLNMGKVVTIVDSLDVSQDTSTTPANLLLCTGSTAGDLKLWIRTNNYETTCCQTITFGTKLPIEARLSFLPNNRIPLLAVAIEDSSVHLFSQDDAIDANNVISFKRVQVLVGHEDWVRCMDFSYSTKEDILLATGSQDSMIRLWRISLHKEQPSETELQQKKLTFSSNNYTYTVSLESVLSGHEGWVYGIHWHPVENQNGSSYQPMKLLSCSLDKSMIIWEPNNLNEIWSETVRVGEVGGNSLGFYGCKFGPHGSNILAHGYQGSFHIWKCSDSLKVWIPRPAPSGHFSEVVDLSWEPKGRYIITVSTDQTTRIHAPYIHDKKELWHEIGRPQVHGYDMSCVATLTPYMFASGAEEKVARIFTAPKTFKSQLEKIANVDDFDCVLADSATVPALGLTNKATFDDEKKQEKHLERILSNSKYMPPVEEDLMQNTLWPELQKLYGHGYEIFAMAAMHSARLLATACKSSNAEHAAIILWSTKTWAVVQKLMSHQLTVTQLAFSPDDKYLVSVSRDRRWSLFEENNGEYVLIAASLKKDSVHTRIIWCCTWSHDSLFFATGSRDGKVGVWNRVNVKGINNPLPATSLEIKEHSVTAIAFAPLSLTDGSYVIAIGYEAGHIDIYKLYIDTKQSTWKKYVTFDCTNAHCLTVKRLMFRPTSESSPNAFQLASCGSDYTVRVYDLNVTELSNL